MKKLIILLSLFITFSFGVRAQYYCIPYLNTGPNGGQNPGGVNTEYDDDCLFAGDWGEIIQDTSGTPVWSSVNAIPFTFKFNGSVVHSFKVSTSAILTFTTNATKVPPFTNAALPSDSIPNNSICVWGLASLGDYASVWINMFGTAPNRQLWIEFADFQALGTESYNFWSIVLEETSNNIYIVDQLSGSLGPLPNLALGIQVNNTTAYSAPGSPDITSLSYPTGAYGDSTSDNSYYRFIPGTLPANDAELTSVSVPAYKLAPANVNISGLVTNVGLNVINTFAVNYQNGANVYTDTIKGANIATGEAYSFTHNTPFNVANATDYPLKVWVDLAGDVNHANDTLNANVDGLAFVPLKNVVFEESTGTWCGFCPGGIVCMDSLSDIHSDRSMIIVVHDYDPMTDVANDTLYDDSLASRIPGFPAVTVDRNYIDGNVFNVFADYNQFITDTVPCDVSLTTSFNATTRLLTINASGHFATDLTGDYRFNAVITEDSVHGTTANWAQYDYYSEYCSGATGGDPDCITGATLDGAGHDWVTAPFPVPASTMYYNHVERAILAGFRGQGGSLPASISAGSTQTYTFTYTVPVGYNANRIKVIVWVINASNGQIYNAAKVNSIVTGINEESAVANHLLIYPNPSTGLINIRSAVNGAMVMKLNVLNSLGQTVMAYDKLNISNDNQLIDMSNFSNGLYFLQFIDENNRTYISKIAINR